MLAGSCSLAPLGGELDGMRHAASKPLDKFVIAHSRMQSKASASSPTSPCEKTKACVTTAPPRPTKDLTMAVAWPRFCWKNWTGLEKTSAVRTAIANR